MKKLIGFVCVASSVLALSMSARAESPSIEQLKARLAEQVDADSKTGPEVKAFVKDVLLGYCTNPVFVQEITAQNAKGRSLDEIKKIDAEWAAAEDLLPIHEEVMGNACANEVIKVCGKHGALRETFVMDNQGANVGQNDLTSDFWQGDEPKWQNSYNNGQGGVDIGKNELDKSSNMVMQRVSLPIVNEAGEVIGAVSYGIATDQL